MKSARPCLFPLCVRTMDAPPAAGSWVFFACVLCLDCSGYWLADETRKKKIQGVHWPWMDRSPLPDLVCWPVGCEFMEALTLYRGFQIRSAQVCIPARACVAPDTCFCVHEAGAGLHLCVWLDIVLCYICVWDCILHGQLHVCATYSYLSVFAMYLNSESRSSSVGCVCVCLCMH